MQTKKSGTGEILKKELLDVLLDGEDLWLDLASLVLGHARRDHGTGDATSPAKSLLGANEDVGNVLVLAEQGDVQQDLERLAVGGKHHELGLATVQSLGRLICPLAQLLVIGSLLDKIEDLGGERLLSQGVSLGVNLLSHLHFHFLLSALLAKK